MAGATHYRLRYSRAPGDDLILTAFVRDLKLKLGPNSRIAVDSKYPDLWINNPHVTPLAKFPKGESVRSVVLDEVTWSKKSNLGHIMHYVQAHHCDFERRTGLHVPLKFPRPDLHLTEEERTVPLVAGKYWVIVPGGKTDMTNKIWAHDRYQEVVDRLHWFGLRFVQEGARNKNCVHPRLNRVLPLVGRTSIRQMIRNIYHSQGVICGVSLPMHIAAALQKPCVVLAGGREAPWWEEYSNEWPGSFQKCPLPVTVPHRFLHTIGLLDCCKTAGCWKRRVVPLHDNKASAVTDIPYDSSLCQQPCTLPRQIIPKCLDLITAEHVIEAVMWYYEKGYVE